MNNKYADPNIMITEITLITSIASLIVSGAIAAWKLVKKSSCRSGCCACDVENQGDEAGCDVIVKSEDGVVIPSCVSRHDRVESRHSSTSSATKEQLDGS